MDVVTLKLPYSFPVKLSEDELLLELLFIFYHDIGPANFHKHFQYKYENSTLRFISDIKTYDEWIYSLNGKSEYCLDKDSTWSLGDCFRKTSLIACRDYGLSLVLKSRDWSLKISKDTGNKRILYYNDVCNYLTGTELRICGVDKKLYEVFLKVLKDFKPINCLEQDDGEDDSAKFERITIE